jgi:hypothetical protein
MKKVTLTLFLGIFSLVTIFAQSTAKIEFNEEVHEFGEIPEGPKATHEFHFTNTGNSPLILTNVRTSCGCTSPFWPREPIAPGESSKISVEYNTQNRVGPFNRSVTITSNADTPSKQLFIKGTVVKEGSSSGMPTRQRSIVDQ